MTNYDVIVIGSGPGGYVCAIRCAQLGLKTAIVEGRDTLGGTCLNVGCIPSKALLHASHSYHEATHNFEKMGLIINSPKIDFKKMQDYKNDVIAQNTKGIEFLLKKNKIDWLKGWAKLNAQKQVIIDEDVYDAKSVVIATGSEASSIPNVESRATLKKISLVNVSAWGWFKYNSKRKNLTQNLGKITTFLSGVPALEQGLFFSKRLYFSIGGIGEVGSSPFAEISKRFQSRLDPQKPLPALSIRTKNLKLS